MALGSQCPSMCITNVTLLTLEACETRAGVGGGFQSSKAATIGRFIINNLNKHVNDYFGKLFSICIHYLI